MKQYPIVPLTGYREFSIEEMRSRLAEFQRDVQKRRTVRDFSDRPVPRDIIETALRAAGSAPSGANLQPWHFVVVSDADMKKKIRVAAEEEEREFYQHRASAEWLAALEPLGTDTRKPFLEIAPYLIAVFMQKTGVLPDGRKVKHYYPAESTGLATGILITALHRAGLVLLTHTPSPMGFLNGLLDRPKRERPFLLLVVGYPADGAMVPDIRRKRLDEFVTFVGD
ncbi:MAG: nitroreductase family protein [Gammaproteobacteria bacterium]|nr:MAG: nitroreductase family protein [Gammaproteobacteria bacterium]